MKHHLLAMLGLHPKVLTETLYGLCVKRRIAITKVIGIASGVAKQKIVSELLNPVAGEFYKLCREYPECFTDIQFSAESVRVACLGGDEIADIANSRQSQAYLDLIMGSVMEMTTDKQFCLHTVVAGGRRTMSVYLAMVMQLLARPQDHMYHLFVAPWEAETNSDFFFPPRQSRPMTTYGGLAFDAKDVHVELVEIPFLRLRPHVPAELLRSPDYQDILAWVQREVNVAPQLLPLSIDVDQHRILIGAIPIPLEPAELAIYWYFVEKSAKRDERVARENYESYFEKPKADGHFSRQASARMKSLYETLVQRHGMRSRFLKAFSKEGRIDLEHLRPHFSNLKRKICERFPEEDFHRWYVVSAIGPRGDTCYGIRLDREFIRLPEARL
ncbi:TIGR02584 family CRISPR-associated protein [candidate division KSB1 bacterium]|nr:TIGR02584 family CRISPR-associated protein [candidate division KSB1 bacterium]